jgi:hypothetical protein
MIEILLLEKELIYQNQLIKTLKQFTTSLDFVKNSQTLDRSLLETEGLLQDDWT